VHSSVLASTQNTIQTIANVGAAIGTISAVIVALFLQIVRVHRRRPALSLVFSGDANEQDLAFVEEDHFNLYVRLKVKNMAKKDTARNVEVLLLHVHRPPGASESGVVPSRGLTWADIPQERINIPPNVWRRVDLLNLWAERQAGGGETVLTPALIQYDTKWPPAKRQQLVAEGDYSLDLAVTGENCDATYWTVRFAFRRKNVTGLADFTGQIVNLTVSKKAPSAS
jgi:hypothetical protein